MIFVLLFLAIVHPAAGSQSMEYQLEFFQSSAERSLMLLQGFFRRFFPLEEWTPDQGEQISPPLKKLLYIDPVNMITD